MEAEQAPPPSSSGPSSSSSGPSSSSSAPSSSSSAPSSSSSITDSVPTSSSPFSNVAPTSSPSFSTTLVSATTTTMATSTATSDTTATVTTTTTTTRMIDIPPILGATATTSTSTGETNSLTSTSISSSTTAPTAVTTISTSTTTITTSPFSSFDHQPPSNALPLRPSFPINRNRPQMPPPIPPPHFAQHLPSPSPPPLPFSSSSPASSSSVGVPSLLASSSSSSSSLSSSSSSSSPSPPPSATSPSSSSSPLQRGGLAIGVPAYPPRPQSTSLLPSSTFGSPPFGHQLGSLGRISDQTQSASPQVRPGMQGIQTIGMMGALSGSQIRPGAAAAHLPPRPAQQQLRPQSPSSSQPSAPQKQQAPGLSRVSSFGPGNSQPPSMPHSPQSHTQPWMSTQGRSVPASVLSSASYRPQFRSSILQQRSTNTQQQQNPIAVAPQQQQQQNVSSQQQQQQPQQQQQQQQPQQNTSQMQHAAENYPQTHQPSRIHPVLQPQQGLRPQGSVQKSIAPPSVPSAHHGSLASTKASEPVETGNQILSKRSIHELLAQIDPLERLDPEVEDVMAEIADDFVESITTFACSLAKHRKSTTLEAKDILLHMERNWNMTLPGFSADEIKIFKKPPVNDIHKQRMVAIKKSYITTQAMAETANVKGSSGQVPGNVKGHPGKGPAMTSPKT